MKAEVRSQGVFYTCTLTRPLGPFVKDKDLWGTHLLQVSAATLIHASCLKVIFQQG
jgi:hypothetical protein